MKLVYTPQPQIALYQSLCETLLVHKSENIALFLSGGSSICVYQYFADKFESFFKLAKQVNVTRFDNLTIALCDDRWFENAYDKNINFNQIYQTKFIEKFENLGAKNIKITQSNDFEKDADNYSQELENLKAFYKIAITGIGHDGHTCGIFPQISKIAFEKIYNQNKNAVCVHVHNEFSNRITMTPAYLKKMNEINIFAIGTDKQSIIRKILNQNEIYAFPAAIYKSSENTKLFTDQLF